MQKFYSELPAPGFTVTRSAVLQEYQDFNQGFDALTNGDPHLAEVKKKNLFIEKNSPIFFLQHMKKFVERYKLPQNRDKKMVFWLVIWLLFFEKEKVLLNGVPKYFYFYF